MDVPERRPQEGRPEKDAKRKIALIAKHQSKCKRKLYEF